jgi:hypothetical protein
MIVTVFSAGDDLSSISFRGHAFASA